MPPLLASFRLQIATVGTDTTLLWRVGEKAYTQPLEFRPERWIDGKGTEEGVAMVRDPAAYAPFSLGTYNCIGKGLALMTLRVTLARLLGCVEFMPAAAGGSEEGGKVGMGSESEGDMPAWAERFEKGARTQFVTLPGRLDVVFTKR